MPSTMCLMPRRLLCCFNLLGMKDISMKLQCSDMHKRRANRKSWSGTIQGMILMMFKLSLIELIGCRDKSASNPSCQSCRRNLSSERGVFLKPTPNKSGMKGEVKHKDLPPAKKGL